MKGKDPRVTYIIFVPKKRARKEHENKMIPGNTNKLWF